MSKNIAVILAGGSGLRMGLELPKQFLKVAGKAVLEHTVEAFQHNKNIDEIVIVSNQAFIHLVENYVLANNWPKVKKILNGGTERYDSSLSAINAYSDQEDINLIFHDAVRPLVSDRIIDDVIASLETYDAVDTAVDASDTIIQVDNEKNVIAMIPKRSVLRRGQTPQAFKIHTVKSAYELAMKDPDFIATDDCGVISKYLPDVPIFVVKGDEQNFKLTYREDIFLLDKLFQMKTTNIGHNPDITALANKVVVVFGGSLGIGAEMVALCKENWGKVHCYSRSKNGCDIRNNQDVKKALAEVFAKEGQIDYIVNTAAILSKEPLASMSEEKIDEVLDINLKGVVNVALEGFPYLKKSRGHLLFYTSSSYTRGRAFYSLYSATKAAVVNFVQAISSEWEPHKIHVNCVNPERTKTPMRVNAFGKEPEGTLLSAQVVARVSLGVLCSDLNGQIIDVKINE
jgi:2-C-methyl-D-erythritol 4-phosphate cytidylyltransferase